MAHRAGISRDAYTVTDRERRMVEAAANLLGVSKQAWVHDLVMREARAVLAGKWVESTMDDPKQLKLFPADVLKKP
jgi:uncharacterized protein (DUF1778 family)